MDGDARAQLRAAAATSGRSLDWLSALIGRDPGFLPAFVDRGKPAQLDALDRRHLAIYLDVDERLLAEGNVCNQLHDHRLFTAASPRLAYDPDRYQMIPIDAP